MSNTAATAALNHVVKSLRLLIEPGAVFEIRIPDTPKGIVVGYYAYDDIEKAAKDALQWDGKGASTYATLNPVLPDLLARINRRLDTFVRTSVKDADVLRRRWLLVDCDPERPQGIPSTDEEHRAAIDRAAEARDFLSGRGWPSPVEADSGNGGHLLYRVDLPNDADAEKLLHDCLNALAGQFSDEAVKIDTTTANASRVCKVYGTLSSKGDGAPETGRVRRRARVLAVPDPPEIVSESLLADLAEEYRTAEAERKQAQANERQRSVHRAASGGTGPESLSDDELLEIAFSLKNGEKVRHLWNGSDEYHNNDASRADAALMANLAFLTGRDSARMERLFSRSERGRRDKWNERPDYRDRTINHAIDNCRETWQGRGFELEISDDGHLRVKGGPRRSVRPATPEGETAGGEEGGEQRTSAAQRMLAFACEQFDLWRTADGVAFATSRDAPRRTFAVRSTDFRRALTVAHLRETGKPATPAAVQAATDTADAIAAHGEVHPIFTRKADTGDAIYLDLGRDDWSVVEVTPAGWRIVKSSPVRFRRPAGMQPLPLPERGGSIADLRPFLNVTDEQFPLVAAWILAALGPHRPYPILCVSGEQGSAKSWLSRFARRMIDPATLELRRLSYEIEDLAVAIHGSFVVGFDNLSTLSLEFSDAFCQIATGGGFGRRKRHTDTDETIVHAMNPLILNGIGEPATRPDLLDRCIMLQLPTIPEERRRDERAIEEEFDAVRPRILGAMLDAVATGLRNLPTTTLERLPRMADFARWAVACEPACPWEPGGVLTAYETNRSDAVEIGIEASPVAALLLRVLDATYKDDFGRVTKPRDTYEGTAEDLRRTLEQIADERTRKQLPANARALSVALKRVAPALRNMGITITDRIRDGRRRYTINRVAGNSGQSGSEQSPIVTRSTSGKSGESAESGEICPSVITRTCQEEEEEEVRDSAIGKLPTFGTFPTEDSFGSDPFAEDGEEVEI